MFLFRHYVFFLCFLSLGQLCTSQIPHNKELRCAACESTIEYLETELNKLDPKSKIQVGGRLDVDNRRKFVSESRSETKLTEILEDICNNLPQKTSFVQTKKSKEWRFVTDEQVKNTGRWAKSFSLHAMQKLKQLCYTLIEENEEAIVAYLFNNHAENLDLRNKVCFEMAHVCPTAKKATDIDEDDELDKFSLSSDSETQPVTPSPKTDGVSDVVFEEKPAAEAPKVDL